MLYNLKVSNFYSIGDEQEFNFTTTKQLDNSVANTPYGYVNKINCIVGNNASGKSNMLKAIAFFKWLAVESFSGVKINDKIPFKPHCLLKNKSSKMEMIFSGGKNLFRLQFEFNRDYIIRENLSYKDLKMQKFKTLYTSTRNNENNFRTRYFSPMQPLKAKERIRLIDKKNSSLFSYLITTGALASLGLKDLFVNFYSNLTERGGLNPPTIIDCFEISEKIETDENLKQKILDTVKTFDIGITDISNTEKSKWAINDANNKTIFDKELISFVHGDNDKSFVVPLLYESEGTIKSISLLLSILELIKEGGLFIVDEIEMSKHPSIVKQLISEIEWRTKDNPNVQLIFTTHQPILLEDRNKSQIFLVEKTDTINSEIYRLDDVSGIRNDENFALKYLSGRYGAVPREVISLG